MQQGGSRQFRWATSPDSAAQNCAWSGFTIESGELTPTLKVKRRVVEKNYQPAIDRAYAEADAMVTTLEQ
jgi:long-subunit acyl-CoA synthetase (AMP-forming)